MKYLVIGDTHFKKIESQIEKDYRNSILKEVSRIIKKNKIKTVIQTGDFFDTRRTLDVSVINETRELIEKYFKNVKIITLSGNHDIYFKNTNKICSTQIIFKDNKNVTVITEPTETKHGLILPWINKENYQQTIELIGKSKSKNCFGHLEINGFAKIKGFNETNGLKPSLFDKFENVISGHFHLVQKNKNIIYIGSLFQNDFNDVGDVKQVLMIENINKQIKVTPIALKQQFYDRILITDKTLKVNPEKFIENYKCNKKRFELILNCKKSIERETFLDSIYELINHSDYKTIDNAELIEVETDIAVSENVSEMFIEYLNSIDVDDKEKKELKELFIEVKGDMK